MDLELITEDVLEGGNLRLDDNNEDYTSFEGERCGICMDIVIDRGVLDCCQHWFCFTCIDNWATITNLCPLCQNEFQLITCVPVYDTIGSNTTNDDSYSRDDDWSVEEKNNTLSFPSYYIDENAVVCLDGDGCKIRSGSATIETDPDLDTSIACDSCDIWYHAFCVGFDPEGSCESSWLCPRCIVGEVPKSSDSVPGSTSNNQHSAETVSRDCSVEASFSGKLSVSVADDGETAVVVSFVGQNPWNEKLGGEISNLDAVEGTKFNSFSSSCAAAATNSDKLSNGRNGCEPNSVSEELELSLSQNTNSNLQLHSALLTHMKMNTDDKGTEESELINSLGVASSTKSSARPFNDKLLESGLDLHLGLSVSSSSEADMINNIAEDQMPGYVEQKSSGYLLSADQTTPDQEEMPSVCSKRPDKRGSVSVISGAKKRKLEDASGNEGESKPKVDGKFSLKKVKAEENIHSYLEDRYIDSAPNNSTTLSATKKAPDSGSKPASKKKNGTVNIMDIVRDTGRRRLKELDCTNSSTMSSKERENVAGLRVKKIMKRTSDDEDSSMIVQKLRKEIREAVRNRSSKEIGDNLFDPKLLAAFRAVVAASVNEPKKPHIDMKAKKALLQKGKVRENLTKKIYGIGGRRKRAWTRDCEIEFWRHRCSKVSKPEKIQTLKSVLDLLRNDTDKTVVKHEREGGALGAILSRLYLADTSVFPRKDDIKPVSALKDVASPEQNKEHGTTTKSEKIPPRKEVSTKIVTPPLSGSKLTKKSVSGVKGETVSSKLHQNKCSEGPSMSKAGSSKSPSKETVGMSDGIKSDRRKWALELLARKTAAAEKNALQETEEGSAMPKGNYPLLAQLPKDMRPVLEPIRHNKVPAAVRQAQLYCLVEHLLRKANLLAMCRTAETELAIADATNIEKQIADRSNSKLVYVNLCSQELLPKSDNAAASRAAETNISSTLVDHTIGGDGTEAGSSDMEANEALKAAGLLPDTPPGSPNQPHEEIEEDAGFLSKIEEDDGPDNVFEMDSQPEFDIYGDFEYNLEDDDFVGASALKVSKLQPEESKIKVVLSIVKLDKSDTTSDTPTHEASAVIEASKVSSELNECAGTSTESSIAESRTNETVPQNSMVVEECEEPSLAECEELYGPDKEPLIKKYPETALMKQYEGIPFEETGAGNENIKSSVEASDPQTENCVENIKDTNADQNPSGSENASNHSQKPEDTQRKEKHSGDNAKKQSEGSNSVTKKVEAYVKEHLRPLYKSGVITVEQYRWAVRKTTEKVMKYHSKAKNANFLIKDGEKVKKLAEQYVESYQQTAKS